MSTVKQRTTEELIELISEQVESKSLQLVLKDIVFSTVNKGDKQVVVKEISTGALVTGVTKKVEHNLNLDSYFISLRDDNNIVGVNILRKNTVDPKNAIDVMVGADLPNGFEVVIIGI